MKDDDKVTLRNENNTLSYGCTQEKHFRGYASLSLCC